MDRRACSGPLEEAYQGFCDAVERGATPGSILWREQSVEFFAVLSEAFFASRGRRGGATPNVYDQLKPSTARTAARMPAQ